MSSLITEKPIEHPDRPGLWIYKNKVMFSIWWLHDQAFCEYKIYLQLEKRIKPEKTKERIEGKQIHEKSYADFRKRSMLSTFENIVEKSKIKPLLSQEFPFRSLKYGIIGRADNISFYPDKFIVVDDKPGPKKYPLGTNEPWETDKNQVYGYCLALKEKMIEEFQDTRPIYAALRKRGSNDIYWNEIFDENAENKIIGTINHIHRLISLEEEYKSNDKPGKCRGCSFNKECDRNISNK
ncbi:MAG: Dna2/Cas4 domain-containing protein [Candidatus Methanoperedens sp.]|nr:Dna2/Cas4 domain-containing protein [Candidatus Methanoperedens sp.]